jgi:hypothetical protein
MTASHFFLFVALLASSHSSLAAKGERLQVGLYEPESRLGAGESGEPKVVSVVWSKGDLRVRLTQAAPCGDHIPVNPVWEKAGNTIVLSYTWHPMPEAKGSPVGLCLKHVQAWVFRVPNSTYTVLVSDSVPVFILANGAVKVKEH